MNWGRGLIIGMVCFMGFILTLVTIMMKQDIDLVTENYYLKELEYNNVYSAHNIYESAGDSIITKITNDSLVLEIPKIFQEDSITGYLFRPNDAESDLRWSFKATDKIQIPIGQLPKGLYELTLTGKCKGKGF